MPYVTQTRRYPESPSLSNSNWADCNWYQDGSLIENIWYDMYDANCNEVTYSYRTGPQYMERLREMTGVDLRRSLLRGEETKIDPSVPGGIYQTGEHVRRDGIFNQEWDQGHEFKTVKMERKLPTVDVSREWSGHLYRYQGDMLVRPSSAAPTDQLSPYPLGGTSAAWNVNSTDLRALYAKGNTAVAQSSPTAPEANLAQFVGELTLLPVMPGLKLLKLGKPGAAPVRDIGGGYLNVQFGIRPFLSDLQRLGESLYRSRAIVDQMIRDSGKVVRRRRTLEDEVTKTTSVQIPLECSEYRRMSPGSPVGPGFMWPRYHTGTALDTVVTSSWFSGAFSYFLSETDTLLGKISYYETLANKLLGSRFDVDTFWELTPFSWLFDWFMDLQSFITRQALLANDSLVLRYGYIMRRTVASRTLIYPNITTYSGSVIPSGSASHTLLRKERYRSTPYGFEFDASAMSAQRWAILAALGLTQSPGVLRSS